MEGQQVWHVDQGILSMGWTPIDGMNQQTAKQLQQAQKGMLAIFFSSIYNSSTSQTLKSLHLIKKMEEKGGGCVCVKIDEGRFYAW